MVGYDQGVSDKSPPLKHSETQMTLMTDADFEHFENEVESTLANERAMLNQRNSSDSDSV